MGSRVDGDAGHGENQADHWCVQRSICRVLNLQITDSLFTLPGDAPDEEAERIASALEGCTTSVQEVQEAKAPQRPCGRRFDR